MLNASAADVANAVESALLRAGTTVVSADIVNQAREKLVRRWVCASEALVAVC